MIAAKGYAAKSATSPLGPFTFSRRDVGPKDVLIDIAYCGVCHSDLHQIRDEWGGSIFPMVPGHEIVGHVAKVGGAVTKFKVGDPVGVGCLVDSCHECRGCRDGLEQYCEGKMVMTYNSYEKDGKTPTYGGYSSCIVVDEAFTLKIPKNLPLDKAAPLLCAGITTYSPLHTWGVGKGHKLGVIGLGGLGHMAVKIGAALGAEVTVLSTSRSKEADSRRLGAAHFAVTKEDGVMKKLAGHFDFLLDTVSAPHDVPSFLNLLRRDGTMIVVGVPPESTTLPAAALIMKRRRLVGSLIGGLKETQEMLNFCGEKNIVSDVEIIAPTDVQGAYERMLRGDVKYRFVIDLAKL